MSEDFKLITDEVLRFMEQNTIDHINTSRRIESSIITEYYLTGIDFNTVYRNNLVSSGNWTTTSTGKSIQIPSKDRLICFPTTKRLYDREEAESQSVPQVETLAARGLRQKRSFMVYLNGLKIPDVDVFVYASAVGTDLYIPAKHFDTINPNTIVCTVRDFGNSRYNNYVSLNHFGSTATVPYRHEGEPLTKKMVQVWINGLHVKNERIQISLNGNSFGVSIQNAPSSTYRLEIMVDKKITGRYVENYVNSQKDLFLYIPESSSDLTTEKSIFLHMCDIYIDGYKISNQDLIQKTHRHIYYKKSNPLKEDPYQTEIVISDKQQSEQALADYMDEFMKYERWASAENELKILANEEPENLYIKPDFIDYTQQSFPPENKYIVDSDVTRLMSNEQRALKMIEENSYYLKSLLKMYAIPEEEYTVTRNPAIPNKPNEAVTILLDMDSEDKDNMYSRLLSLYINEKKIPSKNIEQFEQWKTDNVRIPISYFSNDGVDKVRLYKYPTENYSPKWVRFNPDGESWVGTHTFKPLREISTIHGDLGVYNINELKVFVSCTPDIDNQEYYFIKMKGVSVYYRIIEDKRENYTLREVQNPVTGEKTIEMQIPLGSNIDKTRKVMIVNPNYFNSGMFDLNTGIDPNWKDRIILNTSNTDGELIPVIFGPYMVQVFLSGELLVPDLDYFIVTPETFDKVTSTSLIFRRQIKPTDVIEFVHTGGRNTCLSGYEIIPKTNKYGFVFFENLRIPFSLEYMDMFVNGKKMRNEDIEVYTDRLVRVKNEALPFLNVMLFSRLKVGLEKFEPYIQEYLARQNDFDSYIRQYCGKVIFDDALVGEPIPYTNQDINVIYETEAPDDIDDSGKTPNPVTPGDPQLPIRFNPLLNRLATDYMNDINKITKYFDSNVRKPVFFDEYLMIIEEKYRNSHEIPFDANSTDSLSVDFVFDPNKYYRSHDEVLAMLVKMMSTGAIDEIVDAKLDMSNYRSPLLKTFLYPADIITLDSNRVLKDVDETVVLDSNLIVDKPQEE